MNMLIKNLRDDFRRKASWCYERDDLRCVIKAVASDGSSAMILYRLMQAARRWRLFPLEWILSKLLILFGQCVIGRGATFGPELVFVHSLGIVLNGAVRGGARVTIEHQVTIGAEGRRSPVLGDDVFIGAGAKIIGPVTIGNGARIGANAVVIEDVPPFATAVGIPARVVKVRNPDLLETFDGTHAMEKPAPVRSANGRGGQ